MLRNFKLLSKINKDSIMFSKRKKIEFPPGTFIPTPARVMAILQLCIAFTVIISSMGYPFMGELFANKSRLLLYHTVMGGNISTTLNSDTPRAQQYRQYLERNAERFEKLPFKQKSEIIQQHSALLANSHPSFLTKLGRSFHILAFELPALEQAWLLLSIIIPILVLKRVEGAARAAWLLPLLVLAYAIDNRWHSVNGDNPEEAKLFPSEQIIVQDYLKTPLSNNILEQEGQLRQGWKLYLIKEWAKEVPSQDKELFEKQAEEGEYAFDVARLEANSKDKLLELTPFQKQESLTLLFCYLLWNVSLAWCLNKYVRQ